jgi:AcrR family transcriptional regulator
MDFQNARTAGSTRKGADTRAKILDAAAKLFAANGFEATTFAMIGDASGTKLGSITHSFGDKAELARIIYASAMDRLASAVARALDRHPLNVSTTITDVITACFSWAERHPADISLVRTLHQYAGPDEMIGTRARLEPLIAAWAEPLIRAEYMRPLVPAQLYAVIITPALAGAIASVSLLDGQGPPEIDWGSVLSAAALAAVLPQQSKPRPVKNTDGKASTLSAAPASPKQGSLI